MLGLSRELLDIPLIVIELLVHPGKAQSITIQVSVYSSLYPKFKAPKMADLEHAILWFPFFNLLQ